MASAGEAGRAAPPTVHEARESLHRRAADSVLSIEGLLDDAHTKSWDAAIATTSAVRIDTLSAREVRCCRRCNQGRLTMLLGRLSKGLWELGNSPEAVLEQNGARRRYLNILVLVTSLLPILHEEPDDTGVQHMLWTVGAETERAQATPKPRRALRLIAGTPPQKPRRALRYIENTPLERALRAGKQPARKPPPPRRAALPKEAVVPAAGFMSLEDAAAFSAAGRGTAVAFDVAARRELQGAHGGFEPRRRLRVEGRRAHWPPFAVAKRRRALGGTQQRRRSE